MGLLFSLLLPVPARQASEGAVDADRVAPRRRLITEPVPAD
jgi:hypothetical protein